MNILQNYNQDRSTSKIKLRPGKMVMRLNRMGAFHQSRLSFMRVLLRKLRTEKWFFDQPIWRIDHKGVGVATYCAHGPERTYTLIVFSHDLKDDLRSDRVIAKAWDATFTLCDGEVDEELYAQALKEADGDEIEADHIYYSLFMQLDIEDDEEK